MPNKRSKLLLLTKRNERRSLKARRRFRKHRNDRNKRNLGKNKRDRRLSAIKRQYVNVAKAVVPPNFTFLDNPKGVILFIAKLKGLFAQRREVFVEMDDVRLIDYSAIIVLLSIMVRFKTERIKFNGDFPRDPVVNNIFRQSGFFQILNNTLLKNRDKYDFGNPNSIHTHASKMVDPDLGPKIMLTVSNHILGKSAIYKGLQRCLIELMQNSFNHAEPAKEGDKHWWISVNLNEKSKLASFSFIDYGIGIFNSLNSKGKDSKWYNWRNLLEKFKTSSNAEVLKLMLEGELHKTVTGQDFRGKGLPGIKEAMDRNLISKLFIVTNDVYANVSENIYLTLPNNFEGTFVYFEINEATIAHPWTLSISK